MGATHFFRSPVLAQGEFPPSFMPIAVVVVIGMVALIVLAAIAEKRAQERRRQEFAALAKRLGFRELLYGLEASNQPGLIGTLFSSGIGGPTELFLAQFEGFHPFGIGHSYRPGPIIEGDRSGIQWVLFDYEYKITTSTGKTTSTTTYHTSIVAARLPFALPQLSLTQEGFFSKLGELVGIHDIQLESDEFNERYRVKGSDQKAIFDLLHPEAIEFLLRCPNRNWQMAGLWTLIVAQGKIDLMEYQRTMDDVAAFFELVPEYYRQDRAIGGRLPNPLDAVPPMSQYPQ